MQQPPGWVVAVILAVLPCLTTPIVTAVLAHAWPSPPVSDSRPQQVTVMVIVVIEDIRGLGQQVHRNAAPQLKTHRHR